MITIIFSILSLVIAVILGGLALVGCYRIMAQKPQSPRLAIVLAFSAGAITFCLVAYLLATINNS